MRGFPAKDRRCFLRAHLGISLIGFSSQNLCNVLRGGRKQRHRLLDFDACGEPRPCREVKFLDNLPVSRVCFQQRGDAAVGICNGLVGYIAVNQVQGLNQTDGVAPLALAGRFARRAAEEVQESAGSHGRIRKLDGAESDRHAGVFLR